MHTIAIQSEREEGERKGKLDLLQKCLFTIFIVLIAIYYKNNDSNTINKPSYYLVEISKKKTLL